jgi:putative ABC transport system permease protein
VNFGITISIALIVGLAVAGQTFYMFTIENLKQFGALKAIGVSNVRLLGMVMLQAITAAATGYALGSGMAATFFFKMSKEIPTRGIVMPWQIMVIVAALMLLVTLFVAIVSVRKVMVLEPASVFRS